VEPGEGPALFVRPRSAAMLGHIQSFAGIDRLAGFVLPKVNAANFGSYHESVRHSAHLLMPTLETAEALDPFEVRALRERLSDVADRILALRIGGNDLLQCIGARRSAERTAYDGPLGTIIANLVSAFAPYGFALSAPVFEHFANGALLREEVERDIEHGLLTKTAIHPNQIGAIQARYAVTGDELAEARAILGEDAAAVFASRGAMCEPRTHGRWASAILRRYEAFGMAPQIGVAASA
jgi:citrate lyase beta subunit